MMNAVNRLAIKVASCEAADLAVDQERFQGFVDEVAEYEAVEPDALIDAYNAVTSMSDDELSRFCDLSWVREKS